MNKFIFCLLFIITSICTAFMPASEDENSSEVPATMKAKETIQSFKGEKIKPFKALKEIRQLKKALKHSSVSPTLKKELPQTALSKKERKQFKKQLRKSLWKSLTNKEGENGVHWAAIASLISGAGAVGILGIGLAVGLASSSAFSFLIPFALLLAIFGLITAFVGLFKSGDERFRGGMTLTYSIIGGILSFLFLAFVALVIIALASLSI